MNHSEPLDRAREENQSTRPAAPNDDCAVKPQHGRAPENTPADQPIGDEVAGWTPPARPPRVGLAGTWCRLEPLVAPDHGDDLFEALAADSDGRLWTYIPIAPPTEREAFDDLMSWAEESSDPLFFAVIDESGRARGIISLLRINPEAGSIEVGFVVFGPSLQRTRAATETIYLLAVRIFDLGYRRFEWKANALNAASSAAAIRFGFDYEGTFRQAMVANGRNRDTAWFAMIDRDWPGFRAAFEHWLAPANFDADGHQRERLSNLTAAVDRTPPG